MSKGNGRSIYLFRYEDRDGDRFDVSSRAATLILATKARNDESAPARVSMRPESVVKLRDALNAWLEGIE